MRKCNAVISLFSDVLVLCVGEDIESKSLSVAAFEDDRGFWRGPEARVFDDADDPVTLEGLGDTEVLHGSTGTRGCDSTLLLLDLLQDLLVEVERFANSSHRLDDFQRFIVRHGRCIVMNTCIVDRLAPSFLFLINRVDA